MFNVGGGEIMLIALLALIVVGPEQLPGLLRKLGYYAGQARQMSNALRQEFMAGAEPFQESMREFQRGMADFSNTVTEAADPKRWGSGTADDPVVPHGFADQGEGPSEPSAEPIPTPDRPKKLTLTPPPNPWAPLPGSGAATRTGDDGEATADAPSDRPDDGGEDRRSGDAARQREQNQRIAPAVPPPPPLTGYRGDIEDASVDSEAPEPDEEPV